VDESQPTWRKPDTKNLREIADTVAKMIETGLKKDIEMVQRVKELYELRATLANAMDKERIIDPNS